MPTPILIKSAKIVNEGKIIERDVRISGERITHIDNTIPATHHDRVIDAQGLYLLPGMMRVGRHSGKIRQS